MITLTFFLLLDGAAQFERLSGAAASPGRDRVSVDRAPGRGDRPLLRLGQPRCSPPLAGLFTWRLLELLGVDLAVPLAMLVAFLDLVPLIGFTIGGVLVARRRLLPQLPGRP